MNTCVTFPLDCGLYASQGTAMNLPLIIAVALALPFGALLAWLYASSRANRLRSELAGLSAQLLETRNQVQAARAEIERLRKDLSNEQTLRTRAETERQSERANLEEQKRILGEAETKLREAFQSLAASALQQSNEQFLHLAQERLDNLQQQAAGDLAQRQESIKGLVDPLQQRLTDLQSHLGRLESNRESAYAELRHQVQSLAHTNRELHNETGSLVITRRPPQL